MLQKLKEKGYSTNRLRKENLLSESTIQNIRDNKGISSNSIDIICGLLKCQPNDIMKHVIDEK